MVGARGLAPTNRQRPSTRRPEPGAGSGRQALPSRSVSGLVNWKTWDAATVRRWPTTRAPPGAHEGSRREARCVHPRWPRRRPVPWFRRLRPRSGLPRGEAGRRGMPGRRPVRAPRRTRPRGRRGARWHASSLMAARSPAHAGASGARPARGVPLPTMRITIAEIHLARSGGPLEVGLRRRGCRQTERGGSGIVVVGALAAPSHPSESADRSQDRGLLGQAPGHRMQQRPPPVRRD
jgi:hypothetical protein